MSNPYHDPKTGEFTTAKGAGSSGYFEAKRNANPSKTRPPAPAPNFRDDGVKRFGQLSRREKAALTSRADLKGTVQSTGSGKFVRESSRSKPMSVLSDDKMSVDGKAGWSGDGRLRVKSPLPGRKSIELAASGDQVAWNKATAEEKRQRIKRATSPESRAKLGEPLPKKELNFYARQESPAAVRIQTSKALERDFHQKRERDAAASMEAAIAAFKGPVTKLPAGKAQGKRKPMLQKGGGYK